VLKEGHDATILTFGPSIEMAMEAREKMAKNGISVKIVNARFIKPLDHKMLHELFKENKPIMTIEEAVLEGGFGSAVLEFASDHGYDSSLVDRMGIPDYFVEHGSVDRLLEEIEFTTEHVVTRLQKRVNVKKTKGLEAR
jgi:1-deoxy-D-xylulose-5-phosphate synthase